MHTEGRSPQRAAFFYIESSRGVTASGIPGYQFSSFRLFECELSTDPEITLGELPSGLCMLGIAQDTKHLEKASLKRVPRLRSVDHRISP